MRRAKSVRLRYCVGWGKSVRRDKEWGRVKGHARTKDLRKHNTRARRGMHGFSTRTNRMTNAQPNCKARDRKVYYKTTTNRGKR